MFEILKITISCENSGYGFHVMALEALIRISPVLVSLHVFPCILVGLSQLCYFSWVEPVVLFSNKRCLWLSLISS